MENTIKKITKHIGKENTVSKMYLYISTASLTSFYFTQRINNERQSIYQHLQINLLCSMLKLPFVIYFKTNKKLPKKDEQHMALSTTTSPPPPHPTPCQTFLDVINNTFKIQGFIVKFCSLAWGHFDRQLRSYAGREQCIYSILMDSQLPFIYLFFSFQHVNVACQCRREKKMLHPVLQ